MRSSIFVGTPLLFALLSACGGDDGGSDGLLRFPVQREVCSDRNPLRNAYFGDLHIHTGLSFDAANADIRTGPEDAYRFAKGEAIGLPPYDADGNPSRMVQLAHPLDFAAVTDHSEFLAETQICLEPGSAGYDTRSCRGYREAMASGGGYGDFPGALLGRPPRRPQGCQVEPDKCVGRIETLWSQIASTAEAHDDRSSECGFSTFIAYEWTGSVAASNWHRNVIFGTSVVPKRPSSFIEAWEPHLLWDALDAQCLDKSKSCDVLTIPHNGNLSSGRMFPIVMEDGSLQSAEYAARRREMEPLIEIYQHKGSSECTPGASPFGSADEACRFELVSPNVCIGDNDPPNCTPICPDIGSTGFLASCVSPTDYARGALRRGLSERERLEVNPFEFGFIGSTDSHATTGGATSESSWQGHVGNSDATETQRMMAPSGPIIISRYSSPGGLAGIWAEENSRPALFASMRRRETFATSGTRLMIRFFAGFTYDAAICSTPTMVETAYRDGVPMGSILPPGSGAPTFIVQAAAAIDGAPLSRTEIVKGWLDADGTHEKVFLVGGVEDNGATVDPLTCERSGSGSSSLCTTWTDPEFDPSEAAFYYARAFENPSCRWHRYDCNRLALDCSSLPDTDSNYYACCDPAMPSSIEERAWSSPIWYYPPN